MTTPRDPWSSSYGNGSQEPVAAPRHDQVPPVPPPAFPDDSAWAPGPWSSAPAYWAPVPAPGYGPQRDAGPWGPAGRGGLPPSGAPPVGYPPSPPEPPRPPRSGPPRRRWHLAVVPLAVVLCGVVAATVLVLGEPEDPAPPVGAGDRVGAVGPAPPPAVLGEPTVPGEPPIPAHPRGAATLSNPTVTTAKLPHGTPEQWCSMLRAEDIRAATGYDQFGTPDSMLLCTHHLSGQAGYVFVSDIPAAQGAPYAVRGNTAILYQSEPGSCEVSVVLNDAGAVLDIDLRGVTAPRVPPCQSVVDLAGRVFDRLPDR